MLTVTAAAAATGVQARVIRRMCAQGKLPAVLVGKTWLITDPDALSLIVPRPRGRPKAPTE